MTLDELIYKRLSDDKAVAESLATFGDLPALFLQKAPDDTAAGWGQKKYPRAEYLVDMTADPERHSSGVVSVHIYSDDSGKPPEEIAPAVRKALCDVVMQADDGAYCVTWDRTELFEMESSVSPNTFVNGCSLTFLLIAFPHQQTKGPDPVLGMQGFLKQLHPEALVIGKDPVKGFYEPSAEEPAFYARIFTYKTNRQTYALTWMDCTIALHVIAPTPEARNGWVRYLADCLNMEGEVTLMDGSPMLIQEVAVDNSAEYLTKGQISIKGQYSIPRYVNSSHPLQHIYIKKEIEEENQDGESKSNRGRRSGCKFLR